ncbi:MAG: VWA domain-containing protein [Myxococcota bacterium]
MQRFNERTTVTSTREVVLGSSNTDILFIIDNSNSMKEEQDNLIRNTGIFIEELAKSDNAYRVGIVTTDAIAEGGKLRMRRATQSELNAAGCNIGPDNSGLFYLVRPALDDPQSQQKRCRLQEDFIATVKSLGIEGSGREAGLAAARFSVGDAVPSTVQHNDDFLRVDADLALIFMTDEDDCSFAQYGSGPWGNARCYEEIAGAIAVNDFVDFFTELKSSTSGIRATRAALIGGGGFSGEGNADFEPRGCWLTNQSASTNCGCWSSSNDDFFCTYLEDFGHSCSEKDRCNLEACDALPAGRYHSFIKELRRRRLAAGFPGGTFEDSICLAEYDTTLLTIVRNVVLSECFELYEPPTDPALIQFSMTRVDGTTGQSVPVGVPRYDPTDTQAECQSCGDCSSGAWRLVNPTTICLECGLRKQTGDAFTIYALTDLVEAP